MLTELVNYYFIAVCPGTEVKHECYILQTDLTQNYYFIAVCPGTEVKIECYILQTDLTQNLRASQE